MASSSSRVPMNEAIYRVSPHRIKLHLSESRGTNRRRQLHSTAVARDHYATLDISPQASQKDIKAQFYKVRAPV